MYCTIPLPSFQTASIRTATEFEEYVDGSSQQEVLALDTPEFPMSKKEIESRRSAIGIGLIERPGVTFISLRLQIGTHQVVWLMDPHDPRVWTMFERWEEYGAAVFGVPLPGEAQRAPLEFPDASFTHLREKFTRQDEAEPRQYMAAALALILSGEVVRLASSGLSGIDLEWVYPLVVAGSKVEKGMSVLGPPSQGKGRRRRASSKLSRTGH